MADKQNNIIEKLEECKHYDKDNRFMAAKDLCYEMLKSNQSFDETLERRICQSFIGHLEDSSMDVQSNAVNCIQKVSGHIRESNLLMILEKLVDMVLSGKKETIDINSIAIRSSFNEVSDTSAENVIRKIQPKLQQGLTSKDPVIKETCLEIMAEMFKRFNVTLYRQQNVLNKEDLMRKLPDMLLDQSESIRKKATICIGAFAIVLTARQLDQLCNSLCNRIRNSNNKAETLTLIQCIGHMSRTVGQKLGPFIGNLYPVLENSFQGLNKEQSVDMDNALVEASFSSFENLIKRCPKEISPYVAHILNHGMHLLSYDPNYTYSDANEDMGEEEEGGWGSDYEDNDMAGEDDDDTSWKVRQAAAKTIEALIVSRPELLREFYEKSAIVLVDRIKERDDNVKVAVLNAFSALLKSTILSSTNITVESLLTNQPSLQSQRSSADAL